MNKTYTVIEMTDYYVVCHGSRLTYEEAHTLVLNQLFSDRKSYESNLQDVNIFELEANDNGLGFSYIVNEDHKVTYYILDDPGEQY